MEVRQLAVAFPPLRSEREQPPQRLQWQLGLATSKRELACPVRANMADQTYAHRPLEALEAPEAMEKMCLKFDSATK